MDLSPVLAAVLAALLTGALSLAVQYMTNRHARRMAADDRAAALEVDRERRLFEARERRYEDRRDAVIALDREVDRQADLIRAHYNDNGMYPGQYHDLDVLDAPELFAASARVKLLATPEVSGAATALVDALLKMFRGSTKSPWADLHRAQPAYIAACRAMLAEEEARPSC